MAILKNLIVNGVARVIGNLTATKIIKQGGVSSEFLKADGSVDSTSYYHLGNLTSSVIGGLGTLSNNISGNAATATNSDTVNGYHAISDGNLFYKYKVTATIPVSSVTEDFWYATITFARSWSNELTRSLLSADYSNRRGLVYLNTYEYDGSWYAFANLYNGCNIKGIAFKKQNNPIYYVKLAKPIIYNNTLPDGTVTVYSPYNCTITVSATAPSNITFTNIVSSGFTNLRANSAINADNATIASIVNWSGITNKPSSFTPSSHTHTKSEITDFPSSLPASDVYDWAKATTKPSYSWSEINSRPTNVSQFTNDAGYVTTDTTYSTATSNTLGLVKIGYTANGKNYPVQLNDDGKMYVNVPWTDTKRDITDSYNGTSSNISLSQKGGKTLYDNLYNVLKDGYATNAGSSEYSNKLLVDTIVSSNATPDKFDSQRITGWIDEDASLFNAEEYSGITIKGLYDKYSSFWQLAGYSSTDSSMHGLFFREAANDLTWKDWVQIITTENIKDQSVSTAKILSYDGSIKLYALNSNQLNFGGTNTSTTIYFGYQTTDSRSIPTDFIFGGSDGSAKITANGFAKRGINDNNVLLGAGGHKALSLFVQTSGDQSISGTKTFTGTIKVNRAESTTGFFLTSDIRYKNIIESYYSLSDKIAQLPIIKYKWTNRDNDNMHIGSSALSVMSIIPELVSYDNNIDFYSLDYATLGAVAGISACKEVEILKLKIKELELEIIILKSKYNG